MNGRAIQWMSSLLMVLFFLGFSPAQASSLAPQKSSPAQPAPVAKTTAAQNNSDEGRLKRLQQLLAEAGSREAALAGLRQGVERSRPRPCR